MADLPRDERLIPYEDCGADGLCEARTTTPVDVFDLTRDATERIEATDNDKLNALINQLAEITDGKRGTITDLINGIDQVSTAINEREGQLDALARPRRRAGRQPGHEGPDARAADRQLADDPGLPRPAS